MCSSAGHAGILGNSFFVEPQLSYKTESIKLTDLSSVLTEIKSSHPSLGFKLGYRSMIGIDLNLFYDYASGNADITGITEKNKFSHTSTSIQLGVNSLGLVKMYLGAALSNEFKVDESLSVQSFKLKGPAYHAGIQIRLMTYANLGLQYNLNQFNKVEGQAFSIDDKTETYFSKIDTQDYAVYLSTTF